MNTLSIPYPESLPTSLHLTPGEFEREAKMAMAVMLFGAGRLTSGQAAELAGIPRVHFLYEAGRWGVPTIQVERSELAEDLEVARQLHDRHQR